MPDVKKRRGACCIGTINRNTKAKGKKKPKGKKARVSKENKLIDPNRLDEIFVRRIIGKLRTASENINYYL